MPSLSLFQKIEENAAKRLILPPGRKSGEELARYRAYLKVETHRLKILHRGGERGLEICSARAHVLDVLHRSIFEAVIKGVSSEHKQGGFLRIALVALGGYGRGQLNPGSDIDIMLLHNGDSMRIAGGKPDPLLEALTGPGGLIYTLNDIGLKVGHVTRNADDCVTNANQDMQSKTALIEARLIAGDEELFKRMQAVVLAKCVRGHEDEYIAARLEDQNTRRQKYGNSACMQEPNVKNGCGGLRDYQNLLWMSFFKYRATTLRDLEEKEMINGAEVRQLDGAYDFLLRVRNELHYHLGRAADVLTKSVQPSVAHNLGYTDRSPRVRLEKFMRDYYGHSRNIYLITRTVEQRMALLPEAKVPAWRLLFRRPSKTKEIVIDGFRVDGGELFPVSTRIFRDQPRRLIRSFLIAQQRGLKFSPDLEHLIRGQLRLVNGEFQRDPHVHETFREILSQRGGVAAALRLMHEVGFLGKFIPEFGRLTCLVQHEFYHQYAADEHTLMCIQKLDEIWAAKTMPWSQYAELLQRIERPFVLYLALLLHDAGKADDTADHTIAGGRLALRVAHRLGLDGSTANTLRLVIENHLVMAQVSQRRDLDDAAVVKNFATAIQTPENLNLLLLHTVADSLGTSDKLWNGFKDALLWTLYRKTMDQLSGSTEFLRAEEKQREILTAAVRKVLPPHVSEEEVAAHFEHMPPRYFGIHSVAEIVDDLVLVHRFIRHQLDEEERALQPATQWRDEPDRGGTLVKICTWDRGGLFSKIAGSFTATGLNIQSARIFTRLDGVIIDTFFVTTASTGLPVGKEDRDKFEALLFKALTGHLDFTPLIARRKGTAPLYQSVEGERMPTVVRFDNDSSELRTVIELETEDRVGLLFTVSQALTEMGLDLFLAKISTEKGAAVDTFYIGESGGKKVTSLERQNGIEGKLRSAILNLDAAK